MNIIIQSPGFKASTTLESFIHEKLNKLDHHNANIIRADVTLIKGPESNKDNNYCEIRLEVPGYDHFVKKNSDAFEHSIVEAVEALHKMMQRSKDKEMAKRHDENALNNIAENN